MDVNGVRAAHASWNLRLLDELLAVGLDGWWSENTALDVRELERLTDALDAVPEFLE